MKYLIIFAISIAYLNALSPVCPMLRKDQCYCVKKDAKNSWVAADSGYCECPWMGIEPVKCTSLLNRPCQQAVANDGDSCNCLHKYDDCCCGIDVGGVNQCTAEVSQICLRQCDVVDGTNYCMVDGVPVSDVPDKGCSQNRELTEKPLEQCQVVEQCTYSGNSPFYQSGSCKCPQSDNPMVKCKCGTMDWPLLCQ